MLCVSVSFHTAFLKKIEYIVNSHNALNLQKKKKKEKEQNEAR